MTCHRCRLLPYSHNVVGQAFNADASSAAPTAAIAANSNAAESPLTRGPKVY